MRAALVLSLTYLHEISQFIVFKACSRGSVGRRDERLVSSYMELLAQRRGKEWFIVM